MDEPQRVEFRDVVILGTSKGMVRCQVDGKVVGVPRLRMLPGSTARWAGDVGTLVLTRYVAENLGLA